MTPQEIKSAKTGELVALYNKLTGKSIKKFETRAIAEKRVAEAQKNPELNTPAYFEKLTKEIAGPVPDVTKVDRGAVVKRTSAKAGLPGPNSANSGKRLHLKVAGNPRRPGSLGHASFAIMREGMTYEEFRLAGGRSVDLAWDIKHGYVEMK